MKHILPILVCSAAFACKKPYQAKYSGDRLLTISTTNGETFALADTAAAGKEAQRRGYAPSTLAGDSTPSTGLGLAGSGTGAKSNRVCISASYGQTKSTGNGGSTEAPEAAVICGRIVPCANLNDIQASFPWKPGEQCMMADCSAKKNADGTRAGLDPPGTLSETDQRQFCNTSVGRPTAFSLTEYFRLANLASLGLSQQKAASGIALAEADDQIEFAAYSDQMFSTKPQGAMSNATVSLADETLYQGKVMMVTYGGKNVLGLNQAMVDANLQLGFAEQKQGPTMLSYNEGGSTVTKVDPNTKTNPSNLEKSSPNAPSGKVLGLVETAQGNNFMLSSPDDGTMMYGPEGSVQVFVGE